MKPTAPTFELIYRLAITFTIIALLGCGSGSNSADNESTDRSAAITFQIRVAHPPNKTSKHQTEYAIGEPDICNDYLIDAIAVQVYRAQDDTEVATAQADCAVHSLTVTNVPAAENLNVVCKGYVAGKTNWQGKIDNIVALAGQNTDVGTVELHYIGPDTSAPKIVSSFPADDATNVDLNASIVVIFNEALAPGSISDQAITVLNNDLPVPGQVSYNPGSYSIRFMPANALDSETTYTATLRSRGDDNSIITDTAGRTFDDDVSWQFTSRGADDTALPQVIATSPANGAIDVEQQASISVLFSEPMDPESLTDSVFQVSSYQGTVAGSITYDDQTRTLTLTPDAALEPSTLYMAVISTEARDTAQNALAEPYAWQFWTSGSLSLSVTKSGSGTGWILSTPAHIDCGDTCQTELSAGTKITLDAIADESSEFTGWSGDFCNGETGPCTLIISNNATVTADFRIRTYTISTSVDTENGGSITPANASVNHGDHQTFNIQVNPYYHLEGLSVDGTPVETAFSYTFENVTADHTIQAIIKSNEVNISQGRPNFLYCQINANGHVVWYGRDPQPDSDIYYYNGSDVANISEAENPDGDDQDPQINAAGHVVWHGRKPTEQEYHIYYYDGSDVTNISELIDTDGDDWEPQINAAGHVVWRGYRASGCDIYYYNGSNVTNISELKDTDGSDFSPQINASGHVVWYGSDSQNDLDIYYYNGSDVTNISEAKNPDGDDLQPQINASGHVVWHGRKPPTKTDPEPDRDIYYYNGSEVTNISEAKNPNGDDDFPQINAAGHVVWYGCKDSVCDIYYYDGSSVKNISNNSGGIINHPPRINADGHVVWSGRKYAGAGYEIYYYDGSIDIIISSTPNGIDSYPEINDSGQVAWDTSQDSGAKYLSSP